MKKPDKNSWQLAVAAALSVLALAVLLPLATSRGSLGRVSGDEGTYLAMAESLASDFDLKFDERDEERIAGAAKPGRRTVILQRTEAGISYSKPFLSSLLAAPFYAVFGANGFVVANLILLAGALGLLWIALRRVSSGGEATLTVLTVGVASVLLPYTLWKSSDILQAALAMAGLALCLGGLRERTRPDGQTDVLDGRWAPALGIVLLGLLAAMRPPYGLIAGAVPLAFVFHRQWRRALRLAFCLALTLVAFGMTSWVLVGTSMPYKAERATFSTQAGYPAGEDLAEVSTQFESGRATSSLGARPDFRPRVSALAALYFLVGRHTGVLIYFPAALFLVIAAVWRGDRVGFAVLLAVAATSLFFLLWLPFNYFGGGSCIGNRYFLVCYAALPLALGRPLPRWGVAASWILAFVVGGSALVAERLPANVDETSQSHVHAGIFRMMPYETTASDVEGSRDRYFGKDFVRSVDPFVEARPWSFDLATSLPPSEFVLANLVRDEPLRLLVHSGTRNLELAYSDYGQSRVISLANPVGERGLVEIRPSPPRRFHPLWFRNPWDHGKPYWVRVFRLELRSSSGVPAEASVRFLGNEEFPPRLFNRTVLDAGLPEVAVAGSVTTVGVNVRNDNRVVWRSGGRFPIYVSYRIRGADGIETEGARISFPEPVRPTTALETPIEIRWPSEPGLYRVRVDLVAEGVAWFERKTGAPLAVATVEVVDALASDEESPEAQPKGSGG